jgi:hypothetical protein
VVPTFGIYLRTVTCISVVHENVDLLSCPPLGEATMADKSIDTNVAAGVAALAICEALLLALGNLKLMSKKCIADVLDDASAAHRHHDPDAPDADMHTEVLALIERIISSTKSQQVL